MTNTIELMIEALVAVLLMLTIGYCMMLNRRLKLLKADEQSLRATISELVTATEIAERAIAGLKMTVSECESGLGARLASADGLAAELDRRIAAGKEIMERLVQTLAAGGKIVPPQANGLNAPRHDAKAVAAAAQAFAERLRLRVNGYAA